MKLWVQILIFFSFSSEFFSYEAIFLVRKKRREEKMRGRKHGREGGRGPSGGGWVEGLEKTGEGEKGAMEGEKLGAIKGSRWGEGGATENAS